MPRKRGVPDGTPLSLQQGSFSGIYPRKHLCIILIGLVRFLVSSGIDQLNTGHDQFGIDPVKNRLRLGQRLDLFLRPGSIGL